LLYAEAKVMMIMINRKDVESLTAFKRNTTRYVKKIKESGKPLVLTVNGKAEIVVQDAESYRRILELLDRAETAEAVREGLESARRGKTMSLGRFGREMRKKISATKKR
jgi:prevent-host-death family protein